MAGARWPAPGTRSGGGGGVGGGASGVPPAAGVGGGAGGGGPATPGRPGGWAPGTAGFGFPQFHLPPAPPAFQTGGPPPLLPRLSRKERDERVRIALGVVGLDDRLHHFPRQLSG